MESGELTGEEGCIDLTAVVSECIGEVKPLAEQMELMVSANLEPVVLYGNHKNLYAMVSNLVMNAVKYNKPSGRVDISLTSTGASCVLTVTNDGEPIPPEHQARVFERFYRVDKGRSKTVGGTGLGLSIVKHVVDTQGGTVRLESTKEKGTAITITLPMNR